MCLDQRIFKTVTGESQVQKKKRQMVCIYLDFVTATLCASRVGSFRTITIKANPALQSQMTTLMGFKYRDALPTQQSNNTPVSTQPDDVSTTLTKQTMFPLHWQSTPCYLC